GSGLRGYNVYRNGGFLTQVLAPATSLADQGRSASTAYSYTITAVDNAGNQSAPSAAVGATTPACALNPVLEGFVPAVGTARDVTVDPGTGLAYVASSEFGLTVVNVANAAAPAVLGAASPPFYGDHVAVSGSLAVVTGRAPGGRREQPRRPDRHRRARYAGNGDRGRRHERARLRRRRHGDRSHGRDEPAEPGDARRAGDPGARRDRRRHAALRPRR